MRIFRKGEFVKVLNDPERIPPELVGKYGQISRVFDIDKDEFPYQVTVVLDNTTMFRFLTNQTSIEFCEWFQIETFPELLFYMKHVKK